MSLSSVPEITDAADMARYLTDWSGDRHGRARAVVRPGSVAEVQAVVRDCAARGLGIIPQGGNTGLVGGGFALDGDDSIIFSLDRLADIRGIDARNLTVTADAGCILETVKQAVAAEGCLLPISLGAQGSCQLGGNVATNAGGHNVLRYGMARSLVLGLEVVLPDGRLWDGLRPLRKDNRGYDLKQLFIGSEGTLGVVTGVCFALSPKPTTVETAYLAVPSFSVAIDLLIRARHATSDLLTAFEVIGTECLALARLADADVTIPADETAPVHVLLEASASGPMDLRGALEQLLAAAMDDGLVSGGTLAASGKQAAAMWAIREKIVEGQGRHGTHFRSDVSVAVTDVPALIAAARAMMDSGFPNWTSLAYGHAGDGNIHFNALPPRGLEPAAMKHGMERLEEALFDIVAGFGGSISAEHGIGRTKRAAYERLMGEVHLDLARRLKTAIDPQSLMNPGCLVGTDGARP